MINYKYQNKQSGLTLIELSILLIVIGLFTSVFIQFYNIQKAQRIKEEQRYKVFTIADGMADYLAKHEHYPCPGRLDRATNHPEFAQSTAERTTDTNGDGNIDDNDALLCNDTAVVPGGFFYGYGVTWGTDGASRIRIGSIPYKEIGVGKEDVIDAYGNQFTYAVVESQASEGLYTINNNQIRINDTAEIPPGTPPVANVRQVDFVLFSHGQNGAGSFNSNGILNPTTCASLPAGSEQENCDRDAVFATLSDAAFITSTPYDDKLIAGVDELLKWTFIWDRERGSENSIYSRAAGNMAVGLEFATEKVHVSGNLRVEAELDSGTGTLNVNEGGKLQTTRLCDDNGYDCFEPAAIAGLDGDPRRLQCPTGYVMDGIIGGGASCRSIALDTTVDCPIALEYVKGFSIDPSTGTVTLICGPTI